VVVILRNSKNFKRLMRYSLIKKKETFMTNMERKDLKKVELEEQEEWMIFLVKCLVEVAVDRKVGPKK